MSRQTELMAFSEAKGSKRFTFTLQNASGGLLTLRYAPDGWKDAKYRIERNSKYMGLVRSVSVNELTFVKDARDYIRDVYEGQGINAKITFTVYRWNDTTQAYAIYFQGIVDMSTYRIDQTGVKVGIIDNSITEKVKNRESTKVNLRQLTSIGGYEIPPFSDENPRILFPEYLIQGTAIWGINLDDFITTLNDHYVPLDLTISEFDEAQDQTIEGTDPMFLAATADRTMHLGGRITGIVRLSAIVAAPKVRIRLYVNGIVSKEWLTTGSWTDSIPFQVDMDEDFTVTTGNDVSLQGSILNYGETATTEYYSCQAELTEEFSSVRSGSYIAFPIYEALLRNLQIITDSNDCLKSDTFGRTDTPVVTYGSDPEEEYLGSLTRGLFIRDAAGLNDTLPVSFSELFSSLSAIFNLGMGVEEISGTNKVVVESLTYFFSATVICDLSGRIQEDAIEKEVLPDWHYSRIKTGYNSSEYPETGANGETFEKTGVLSEYNTKSEFSTVISCLDNELDCVSKYRGDTMGMVLLRKAEYGSDSEKGDEDIFLINSVRKVDAPYWTARTDQGFTLITGGIDADQWYNLDWTPKRNLLRHGLKIRAGLEHELGTYLRWQTTDKNTTLITQKTAEGEEIAENSDVLVNDLDEPMWYPEAYSCEVEFDYDDLTAILTNPKGLVKLSQTKFGWILNLEVGSKERKATVKLLRCNTNYVTPIES